MRTVQEALEGSREETKDVYWALVSEREGGTADKPDGTAWAYVYLDNARREDMSPHKFAGHLSALSERDGYFGLVRVG